MKVEILVKVIKGDGVSGCGRFMPFWKIGNPSFTPLNQGPDRFVAGEHAMLDSLSEGCLAGLGLCLTRVRSMLKYNFRKDLS